MNGKIFFRWQNIFDTDSFFSKIISLIRWFLKFVVSVKFCISIFQVQIWYI